MPASGFARFVAFVMPSPEQVLLDCADWRHCWRWYPLTKRVVPGRNETGQCPGDHDAIAKQHVARHEKLLHLVAAWLYDPGCARVQGQIAIMQCESIFCGGPACLAMTAGSACPWTAADERYDGDGGLFFQNAWRPGSRLGPPWQIDRVPRKDRLWWIDHAGHGAARERSGSRNAMLDHLFSPLRVGPFLLKNRIGVAPHGTRYAIDGLLTRRYVDYEVEKAKGGAGLIVMSYGLAYRCSAS
jgi:hypothetical protein